MLASLRSFRTAFAALAVLVALCSPALAGLPPFPGFPTESAHLQARTAALSLADRERAIDLNWARNNPSATEISDGRPLNLLLRSAASGRLGNGPTIPLDKDTLKGINWRPAGSGGNLGLLKNGGKLSWPLDLQEPTYDELRQSIDTNILAASNALGSGKTPDVTILKELEADRQSLNDKLDANINAMTPSAYIASQRYLNQLKDTIRGLADPAVTSYSDRSWTSTVVTVGELVSYMTRKGLEFAPADAPGDDASYTFLYRCLSQFEAGVCR